MITNFNLTQIQPVIANKPKELSNFNIDDALFNILKKRNLNGGKNDFLDNLVAVLNSKSSNETNFNRNW